MSKAPKLKHCHETGEVWAKGDWPDDVFLAQCKADEHLEVLESPQRIRREWMRYIPNPGGAWDGMYRGYRYPADPHSRGATIVTSWSPPF